MKTISRIGVLSMAKVQMVMMAIVGFLLGIFYAAMGVFFDARLATTSMQTDIFFSPYMIIVLPVVRIQLLNSTQMMEELTCLKKPL